MWARETQYRERKVAACISGLGAGVDLEGWRGSLIAHWNAGASRASAMYETRISREPSERRAWALTPADTFCELCGLVRAGGRPVAGVFLYVGWSSGRGRGGSRSVPSTIRRASGEGH